MKPDKNAPKQMPGQNPVPENPQKPGMNPNQNKPNWNQQAPQNPQKPPMGNPSKKH